MEFFLETLMCHKNARCVTQNLLKGNREDEGNKNQNEMSSWFIVEIMGYYWYISLSCAFYLKSMLTISPSRVSCVNRHIEMWSLETL